MHDVGVRCIDIQQLIQRQLVFHVVQRRAGKAGWNMCVKEGQACAAGVECAKDQRVAHEKLPMAVCTYSIWRF